MFFECDSCSGDIVINEEGNLLCMECNNNLNLSTKENFNINYALCSYFLGEDRRLEYVFQDKEDVLELYQEYSDNMHRDYYIAPIKVYNKVPNHKSQYSLELKAKDVDGEIDKNSIVESHKTHQVYIEEDVKPHSESDIRHLEEFGQFIVGADSSQGFDDAKEKAMKKIEKELSE